MTIPPVRILTCHMHGSFIACAHSFTNTVGSKNASAICASAKELTLVIKWSEVTQLIVLHVFAHSNAEILQL